MDYEQKYKEALERAKKVHKYSSDLAEIKRMEDIFPELAESEDEKIRKGLIEDYKKFNPMDKYLDGVPFSHVVTWLEKQGQKSVVIIPKFRVGDEVITKNEESLTITRIDEEGYWSNDLFICSFNDSDEWELVEQKPYGQREECLDCQFNYAGECKGSCAMKRSEQNPADKVEPKFHEGEWIVFNGLTLYVNEVVQGYYRTISIGGVPNSYDWNIDNAARLWTIQDAKDGDVLFAENFDNIGGCVFLFKGLDSWRFDAEGDRAIATGYCCTSITESGSTDFGIQGPDCVEIKRVHPATKEQRDLLFQKMQEAGYIFDFEKKELQKIHVIDEGKSEMDYCFTKMMNGETVSTSWSEEDESMYIRTLGILGKYYMGQLPTKVEDELNWFKSIKDRVQLKPRQEWKQENREELTEFENAMMHIGGSFFGENAGLDPNDTAVIKEQAELLLKLAPKQKWSEEDEEMIEGLNNCLDELEKENGWRYIYVNSKNVELNKVRNWLKSFKKE